MKFRLKQQKLNIYCVLILETQLCCPWSIANKIVPSIFFCKAVKISLVLWQHDHITSFTKVIIFILLVKVYDGFFFPLFSGWLVLILFCFYFEVGCICCPLTRYIKLRSKANKNATARTCVSKLASQKKWLASREQEPYLAGTQHCLSFE